MGQKEISEFFSFFVLGFSLVKTCQLSQVLKIYGTSFSHGIKKKNILSTQCFISGCPTFCKKLNISPIFKKYDIPGTQYATVE